MHTTRRALYLLCTFTALAFMSSSAQAKGKKKQHQYVGTHPLSHKADDGYCFINVPHVHRDGPSAKHKALYRDHRGQSHFVADPTPYGYEGDQHPYYGHHPIAVEVVVAGAPRYESGQDLEYCYLDGPHYHGFEPQPGLTFEVKGGVNWYIGELPAVYVDERPRYVRGNKVYATVEVNRPVVEIDVPPAGYVGPVLDVHVHGDTHAHPGRGHARGHVGVGVDVHVETPSIQIGLGLPGVIIEDGHHHHGHRKHKKHKKHRKYKKVHKGKRRGRGHW